ncbi:MAG TPA: zinc-binding dehydrogenase [Feifaniaceae bacterium]|nr:zinc-binding dehydrogenase [Feifaniaceae bacterium]
MKTKAVRLYGVNDIRFEEFDLRDIREDELLASVITDSLCMSTYKAVLQGSGHRCVPDDIATNPVLIGHEFCGRVEQAGAALKDKINVGDLFTVQPKMTDGNTIKGPGYSFPCYGGNATHIIVPAEAVNGGYFLPYSGDAYFKASTAEPLSCLISAARSQYHLGGNSKTHIMGLKQGGCMAILAGCGPMGLGAAEVAMALEQRPRRIVITDIDEKRIARAKAVLKPKNGVEIEIVNTKDMEDPAKGLKRYAFGSGFDDIFIMAPVPSVIGTADAIAGTNSCVNFFAGPTKKEFAATVNFYDVHYNDKHIIGTSGGDIDDMKEALRLLEEGSIDPSILISHIGGLGSAAEATLRLPEIPGAKKLIYCNIDLPLTAIDAFEEKGRTDPLFRALHEICARNSMLWCREAEKYLLQNAPGL